MAKSSLPRTLWTEAEDARLKLTATHWEAREGDVPPEIPKLLASQYERTLGGLKSRLHHLGLRESKLYNAVRIAYLNSKDYLDCLEATKAKSRERTKAKRTEVLAVVSALVPARVWPFETTWPLEPSKLVGRKPAERQHVYKVSGTALSHASKKYAGLGRSTYVTIQRRYESSRDRARVMYKR